MNTEDFISVVKITANLASKGLFLGTKEENILLLESINNIRLAHRLYKSSVKDYSLYPRYLDNPQNLEQFNLRKESLGNVVQELDHFEIKIFEIEDWQEAKEYVDVPCLIKYKSINITDLINIK